MNVMTKVAPVRKPAPYIGGKRILAPRIIKRIGKIPHKSYVEPFVGMGGVFFRRKEKPKCEVINDLNGEVANFFRVLQRHHAPLMDMLTFTLASRVEFERLSRVEPETLTDLERAVRFFYLQKLAFGGKVIRQAFGTQRQASNRFNPSNIEPVLKAVWKRLHGVVIEALPYEECIAQYDSTQSLFYLDPPYWGTEGEYGKELFSRADFKAMVDQLSGIKGRFILSINDTREVRNIFSQFEIQSVAVSYSLSSHGPKRAGELIISN